MVSIGRPVFQVGSNIFELIEFTATKVNAANAATDRKNPLLYGVNVAKVREVIRLPTIVPCLTSAPEVLGVFNLRGLPIPAIHLAKALGYEEEIVTPTSQVIVTEFSRRLAGFVVAGTRRIRRVSWDKVLPPSSDAFNMITGMMLIENQDFIFILDFERILLDIENRVGALTGGANNPYAASASSNEVVQKIAGSATNRPLIMVVDDSPTARKSVCEMIRNMGLEVIDFPNGEAAWNELKSANAGSDITRVQGIVSDIEMPKLDGYSLIKRIRANEKLKALPVILHSSLTGDANRERAQKSGANAYASKLNRKEILEALKLILPDHSWLGVA